MFYIFVVFFLCFFSLTESIPIPDESRKFECGNSDAIDRYGNIANNGGHGYSNRIMGGVVSPPRYWPWIVALIGEGAECTGEIIGDRWIITAKHCKEEVDSGFFVIGTRNKYRVTNETKYEIKTSYLPDDKSDIMLVELSQNLKYSKSISPICISKSIEPKVGDIAVVAGFGTLFIEYDADSDTGVDSEPTNLLHEGLVTIKDKDECRQKINYTMEFDICAGGINRGINRGVMSGDSGGPIMGVKNHKFYLYGSVSGGEAFQITKNDNLTVNELGKI
uniref:Peptidase S1 domain-containing protein n=1 Tax=Panagrolaimus sp. ES5 TaxID=591445 RepID=A0AC34GAX2_9BILA